jgi:DNA repair protein RadC
MPASQQILYKSIVHPREVFADAVSDRAAGIIFVHNHPSGNTEPSEEDFAITEQLLDAAKIMEIDVIDHIIVGRNGYFSFQAAHWRQFKPFMLCLD